MSRITLEDNMMSAVIKMSDGNPGAIAAMVHGYFDARHDYEIIHYGHALGRNWHGYKNISRPALGIWFASLAVAKVQGHVSWKGLLGRFLGNACLSWLTWQLQYHMDAYGDFWDTNGQMVPRESATMSW